MLRLRKFYSPPEFRMTLTSKIEERDWKELNPELLHPIAKKLGDISFFIRFRLVCKQWRAATDPSDPPPTLPWILQPATLSRTGSYTKNDYILYSLFSDSTCKIKLPVTYEEDKYRMSKEISIGFIFARVYQNRVNHLYLYNPLTENKIHLLFTKLAGYSLVCMGPCNMSNLSMVKSGVHLIVYKHQLGQTKIGSWRSDTNEFITFIIPIITFVIGYYKGKVFVYKSKARKTSVFDMTTGAKMNVVLPHPTDCFCFNFFVKAMEDLLAVQYPYTGEGGCNNNQFKVYRLEHTDDFRKCRWIKLKGIGERALFLGRPPGGFCLSASDFEGLRGNSIYYMRHCIEANEDGVSHYNRPLRYDMENGTSEELLNGVTESATSLQATWFLPCLS